MCYRKPSAALGAFGTEAMLLSDAFTAGHSCNDNSPNECWLPVFDRADQRLRAVTSQAQDLYKTLGALSFAGHVGQQPDNSLKPNPLRGFVDMCRCRCSAYSPTRALWVGLKASLSEFTEIT